MLIVTIYYDEKDTNPPCWCFSIEENGVLMKMTVVGQGNWKNASTDDNTLKNIVIEEIKEYYDEKRIQQAVMNIKRP
jgi:hypothetical protein